MPDADTALPPKIPAPKILPPKIPPTYDVCYYVDRRPFLRQLDHGVALERDSIAWTTRDGRTVEMALRDIVAVHLKSTGTRVIVEQCAITFADNSVLTVVNTGRGGYSDREHANAYRDFVRALHARLAAGPTAGVTFAAGVPRARYFTVFALVILSTAFCINFGIYVWFMTGDLKGFALAAVGCYSGWRLGRNTLANAPRDYTPDRLPENLLS